METRVSDQPAFILRRREWRNSSLLLDLLTRDYGRLRVMARAARRNPARIPYQPFALLSLGWSGRQELKTLTGVDGNALPVDERNYLVLMYVNELIESLLPEHEENPQVFDLYLALLQTACEKLDEAALRRFELEFLRIQGYFPELSIDAESGEQIDPASHYLFEIDRGFVACNPGDKHSIAGQSIIDWILGNYENEAVLRLASVVLRSSIDFNLHGKTLKSRRVMQEMMAGK